MIILRSMCPLAAVAAVAEAEAKAAGSVPSQLQPIDAVILMNWISGAVWCGVHLPARRAGQMDSVEAGASFRNSG